MTAEVYKILVLATLLMQLICLGTGFRLSYKIENRPLLFLILIGVGIIFLVQLIDLIEFKIPLDTVIDSPLYFEIISFVSTIVLLLILLAFNFHREEPFPKILPAKEPEPEKIVTEKPQVDFKPIPKFERIESAKADEKLDSIKSELEKVTQQRDKLVSIISHDLRTPLNSIFGFCQLLKDGEYKGKKEVKKFAENIYDLSKIQLNALNKILDWTRFESKELQFNPMEFDVTSTINFIAKSFMQIAERKNIAIKVSSDRNLKVLGDEFMIIELLKNLLENAIKYSREGSTVEIITHYHSKLNKLVILVCDSGIGINKNVLMKLLSTSSKTTARGTKGEKGIGLGLLICKAIIDKHSEHLWIASEEGEWTRVYFTLKPATEHV
ncbi:MAG: HAMP domain-containing histidine kinase [Ignavibacteria bacterium]|nr:HAMP domain-containing histidine kinase [Ignavibacteria bacterium]